VKGRTLSAEEYQRYQDVSGDKFMEAVNSEMMGFNWSFMDDTEKKKTVKKKLAEARKAAREELFGAETSDDWWSRYQ
jgi:hypothetical protein